MVPADVKRQSAEASAKNNRQPLGQHDKKSRPLEYESSKDRGFLFYNAGMSCRLPVFIVLFV